MAHVLTEPRTGRAPALQGFIALLDALLKEPFPEPYENVPYWDTKMPVAQAAIDGPRASHAFRQTGIELLLLGCEILRIRRPAHIPFVRVVAIVTLPELFGSSITVFFEESYYQRFFQRSEPWQTWMPLPPDRSLIQEWALPNRLPERGFRETIRDEDYAHDGEVWVFGDVEDILQ